MTVFLIIVGIIILACVVDETGKVIDDAIDHFITWVYSLGPKPKGRRRHKSYDPMDHI